ncbi:GDSL-type esterase/lipase family protein [Vibrio sp.]|uniref:Arylesterase n=1 Tax=Vibrio viridaestus TaxID=2487322 RepID=A0A3N9TLK4_9VIBR|nr:SGNH/GDSL hydrolase family protein [Vibrio viridaestus]MDC0612423.1 GDSL-type esterase/lipase family protein [Vibrio sp.]RQW65180.1 arylesterase [Vibrio viridaestus]
MMRLLSLVFLLLISFQGMTKTLLILGDSLSAGYQMPIEKAWSSLLHDALLQKGNNVNIVNGSVSGDTTATALPRVKTLLSKHNPDYVLVELGANDGLQGFPLNITQDNLTNILTQIQDFGAQPILMQIRIPPNYGKRYSDTLRQIYPKLSQQFDIPLIPFFMEQVVQKKDWMKEDGLHPNEKAQPWIAEKIAADIMPILSQ